MTMKLNEKPLRQGVVPVLFNLHTFTIFVGRIHNPGGTVNQHWSTVEGGIEVHKAETTAAAARRELHEEIGLKEPIFIAAMNQPLAHRFPNHPRYGGKSLIVAFYGFQPGPRRYLDLDPGIDPEGMAFSCGSWANPHQTRLLLKVGATAERQSFCDQLADVICEVHLAMQYAGIRSSGQSRKLVSDTQKNLRRLGQGYVVHEDHIPVPPAHELPRSKPERPSFLKLAIDLQKQFA